MDQITEGYTVLYPKAYRPCKCGSTKLETRTKDFKYQIVCLECGNATSVCNTTVEAQLDWSNINPYEGE